MSYKLRFTWDGGAKVAQVPKEATFLQLKEAASEASGIPAANQKLMSGFPQKPMELADSDPITGKVMTGDTVVVNRTAEGGAEAVPTPGSLAGPPAKPSPAAARKVSPEAKAAASKKKGGAKRKKADMGPGRTMNDDGPPPAMFKDESNIIEKIAQAASGDKADGEETGVSYLRDALAGALVHQQKETLANLRFKAMLSKNFTIEKMQSQRLGDGDSNMMKVSFKGDSRVWKEDEVDLIGPEALKAVYEHVLTEGDEGAMEHLKPFKMALISPRCFWSMVHHFGDVEIGLKTMFPDRDWSILQERAKRMSEKAIENQRQEEALAAYEEERAAKLARGEGGEVFEPVD